MCNNNPGKPQSVGALVHEMANEPPAQPEGDTALTDISSEDFRPYLVSRCLDDIDECEIEWEWPDKIPKKRLTVIAGDGEVGKSYLTMAIAAAVSTGAPWPDQPGLRREPSTVVMLNCEDDPADTIKKRLRLAGADCKRIHIIDSVVRHEDGGDEFFSVLQDLGPLEEMISRTGATMFVIDPIGAYLGGTDTHRDAAVRAALGPLAAMAARTGCAIIVVLHLNKSTTASVRARVSGSVAFTNAARMCWVVARHPEVEGQRVFLPYKTNITPQATGLIFTITDGAVCWAAGPCDLLADEVVSVTSEDRTAISDATDWLTEFLALGPVEFKVIEKAAAGAGHAMRTLARAKKVLRVTSGRNGFGGEGAWEWSLPDSAIKDGQGPESVPLVQQRLPNVGSS